MKLKMKVWFAALLGTLAAFCDRLFAPPDCVALPNELGLMNPEGKETFTIDAAQSLATPLSRYLLYKRGTAGTIYAEVCDASSVPLGISPDAPYQAGDLISVYRLGAVKGILIGLSAGAIALDAMIVAAASGKLQTLTSIADGTYYIVGKCAKAVTAANQEVPFIPQPVVKVVVASSGTSFTYSPA